MDTAVATQRTRIAPFSLNIAIYGLKVNWDEIPLSKASHDVVQKALRTGIQNIPT
jgi:hypothetical protein